MKTIRLLAGAVFFGYFSYRILSFGVSGLQVNLNGSELKTISFTDKDMRISDFTYSECLIKADTSYFNSRINQHKLLYNYIYLGNSDTAIFYYLSSSSRNNVRGILKPLENIDSDYFQVEEQCNNCFYIDEEDKPRKWYWNLLMIAIPSLYLVVFVKAIFKLFKGEKLDKAIKY